MKSAIDLIIEERKRQIEVEGWTHEHDDQHIHGELANAGAYYALNEDAIEHINDNWGNDMHLCLWPFDLEWIKRTPNDRIRELTKAASLIVAEIERLQRLELKDIYIHSSLKFQWKVPFEQLDEKQLESLRKVAMVTRNLKSKGKNEGN